MFCAAVMFLCGLQEFLLCIMQSHLLWLIVYEKLTEQEELSSTVNSVCNLLKQLNFHSQTNYISFNKLLETTHNP